MTSTFWINSYLRAALPAIGSIGFNAGLALNVTINNVSSISVLIATFVLALVSKGAFAHLASKEHYLWFLGDDAKKSRFLIAYARLIGVGVFLGATLMSIAQYGDRMIMGFSVLIISWLLITEGFNFDKVAKTMK